MRLRKVIIKRVDIDPPTPLNLLTWKLMLNWMKGPQVHLSLWGCAFSVIEDKWHKGKVTRVRFCDFLNHIIWHNLPVLIIQCLIVSKMCLLTFSLNDWLCHPRYEFDGMALPCPLCWVCHLAHRNRLTWCITQHNVQS